MMVIWTKVDGADKAIRDNLVSTSDWHLSKLKRLCEAVGIDYEADEVKPEQLENQAVSVYVNTEEGTGDFDDKNSIRKYAKAGKTLENTGGLAPPNPEIDGDIPF